MRVLSFLMLGLRLVAGVLPSVLVESLASCPFIFAIATGFRSCRLFVSVSSSGGRGVERHWDLVDVDGFPTHTTEPCVLPPSCPQLLIPFHDGHRKRSQIAATHTVQIRIHQVETELCSHPNTWILKQGM